MTRDDLRGIIEGITDEQLKRILDINSADIGRAKSAEAQLRAELEGAQSSIGNMEGEISRLQQLQREAEKMKESYEELQKAADARAEQDRIAKLESRFSDAANGAEFLNQYTRLGVFQSFKEALDAEENSGKSDADIFREITAGGENLFLDTTEVPRVVDSATGFGMDLSDSDVREIMGLF